MGRREGEVEEGSRVVDGVMFGGHDLTGLWGGTGKACIRINALTILFHFFCIWERL